MNRHLTPVRFDASRHQRGVVLVVALIFLLLITMLAVSASGTSLLQQKLAGGLRNAQLAEWSAESAIRGVEWRLWRSSSSNSAQIQCGSGAYSSCYQYDPDAPATSKVQVFRNSTGWVTDGATEYDATDLTKASSDKTFALGSNPYYIIEDLGLDLPQNSGPQHESGVTSSTGTGNTSTARHLYRITARGMGNNPNAIRIIETTFAAKAE